MCWFATKESQSQIATMCLKHPTTGDTWFEKPDSDEKYQIKFKVKGHFSTDFYEESKKFIKIISDKGRMELEKITDENVELLASCIIDWEDNGAMIEPYSPENAKKMLADPEKHFVFQQLMNFVNDRTNFFIVPSSKSTLQRNNNEGVTSPLKTQK